MAALLIAVGVAALACAAVVLIGKQEPAEKPKRKAPPKVPPQFQRSASEGLIFTEQELAMLLELSDAAQFEGPAVVWSSYKCLDTIVKLLIQKFDMVEAEPAVQEFLGKLLDRRKQITLEKLNARRRLADTKDIAAGQEVHIILPDIGVFSSHIVGNGDHLTVRLPLIADLPAQFQWSGQKVMGFFRKRNDAEYSFSTLVVREVTDNQSGDFVLLLRHQKALSRVQKRRSLRVALHRQAAIYPFALDSGKVFTESTHGVLNDLSDDGCSAIIRGKAALPSEVIVQVTLDNRIVYIHGECCCVQYNKEKDFSLAHIKAGNIPRDVKNIILCVMFGILEDNDKPPVIIGSSAKGEPALGRTTVRRRVPSRAEKRGGAPLAAPPEPREDSFDNNIA
jgi:hypothetical protein